MSHCHHSRFPLLKWIPQAGYPLIRRLAAWMNGGLSSQHAVNFSNNGNKSSAISRTSARPTEPVAGLILHCSFCSRRTAGHDRQMAEPAVAPCPPIMKTNPDVSLATQKPPVIEHSSTSHRVSAHAPKAVGLTLNREQLKIHSSGRISEIYGPQFLAQDAFGLQCRMPEPPLLLADRVTGLAAEPATMKTGTIWTETDVQADSGICAILCLLESSSVRPSG